MIQKLITIILMLPVLAMAYTFDDEVPKEVKDQIISDMKFMASIQGDGVSNLHNKIFGKVSGSVYENFIESRVTAVGMHGCGSANAVACVIPFFGASKIWLTKNYVKFSHPQIAKMMVVYHEARHTESRNRFWPHATCPTPFLNKDGNDMASIWTGAKLAGEPACDVTPLGSYGSSLILLKNVQKFCANCSEKVKMDAGIYADNQFTRIIDKTAQADIQKDLYNFFD